MLLDSAARVFDRPQPAERHRSDFFAACLERITTAQAPRTSRAGVLARPAPAAVAVR